MLLLIAFALSCTPRAQAASSGDLIRARPVDSERIAIRASSNDALTESLALVHCHTTRWFGRWHFVSTNKDDAEGLMDVLAEVEGVFVSPVFADDLGGPLVVTPEILLRFNEGVADDAAEAILDGFEIIERDWAGMPGAYKVRIDTSVGLHVIDAAAALASRAEVRYADVDYLFSGRKAGDCVPGDPELAQQWGMHNVGQFIGCGYGGLAADGFDIDAPEAWCVTQGDPSIIVAVLDDGIQLEHPDLSIDLAVDVTSDAGDGGPQNPCDNHGTLVVGNAAALANDLGVVGVAPACRVASVRTFISNTPTCDGTWMSKSSWTVEALQWAYENGARVTNNSNGYGFSHPSIDDKYAQLRDLGVIHFASAGNAGREMITYPASLDTVNAIGMTGPAGVVNANSNYGEGLAFVAPGAAIYTTDRTGNDGVGAGDHACSSGTSHASPVASGVAALVLSVDESLLPDEVEQIMRESALDMGDPGFDIKHGWGMVNAADAVSLAIGCSADCDDNGALNILDFVCFQGLFQAGDDAADCNGDGALNILDFVCFQQFFQSGC